MYPNSLVAVQSVPITINVASSNPAQVYLIPHFMLKFVSDLRQVGGFLRVLRFPTHKTYRHDITEMLLKVSLNTINQAKPFVNRLLKIYFLSCKSKVQTETVMLKKKFNNNHLTKTKRLCNDTTLDIKVCQ